MKNWKTTSAGIAAIGAALTALVAALGPLFDGDLSTTPDWSAIGVAIGGVVAGLGLINARDAAPAPIDALPLTPYDSPRFDEPDAE